MANLHTVSLHAVSLFLIRWKPSNTHSWVRRSLTPLSQSDLWLWSPPIFVVADLWVWSWKVPSFLWLVVFGCAEKDRELGEAQATTMPPNPWLIYHNPNPLLDFSLPHSSIVDCLSISHSLLLITLLVVLRLLVFL